MNGTALDQIKHSHADVLDVIASRWSPRAFSSEDVSIDQISRVLVAAGWAASSYNEQPWLFLVGKKGDETYAGILATLIPFNQSWASSAPVLILSVARSTFSSSGKPNSFALHDLGAATATMALQAAALGMHTHSMAGFDQEMARQSFGIPEDYLIGSVTALGIVGESDSLPEKMRLQEEAPRTRRPLNEIALRAWGSPLVALTR